MVLHSTVLAWAILSAHATLPASSESLARSQATAAPQTELKFPSKPAEQAPNSDFLGWHGWSYLQSAPAIQPRIYDSLGDWSAIQTHFASVKAGKPSQWRLKVVIFTRTESDDRDANGVLRENRQSIESVQLSQVLESIERFKAWATAKFDGRVSIVPDIRIESEWMRDSLRSTGGAFGDGFIHSYLEARINGGNYEAEDKVFRGPYNSVLYLLPGSAPSPVAVTTMNGTPVEGISVAPVASDGLTGYLDNELRSAWLQQVGIRVKEQGFKGISVTSNAPAGDDPWPIASDLDEAPAQTYLSRLSSTLELWPAVIDPTPVKVSVLPESEPSIASDTDRGQVLRVVESGGFRAGGVALPERSDGKPLAKFDSTPTLSFYAKSLTKDPIAIRLEASNGKVGWVSVGRDPILASPMSNESVISVAFVPDGKWQKLAVDLRPLIARAGITDVVRMAIEPSPNAKLAGKQRPDPIDYEFDEFKFSSDEAPAFPVDISADATSADDEARAMFAAQAKTSSPALALLLKDKSELVRLNACEAYIAIKDPTVETALISNSLDLDSSVAAAALSALMAEGSETAVAVVRRSVRIGLSDYAKQIAARLLAETKDEKIAGDVSLLYNNRSWQARLSAVESLALIPSKNAGIMRLAFINGLDPEIKLAVTRSIDPSRDEDSRILLWSAVNEPWDMVRAESDIKLIESPEAAQRTEGYKGVRDDSRFVRLTVVNYLAGKPNEENRNALRLAISDRSADVRAAALHGFASLDKGASSEEITTVLDDQDPIVQLALIDFSKKKNVKLPQKTVDAMLSSPDTQVANAAKGLGT